MATCQRCGAENRDEVVSCAICGAALDPQAPRSARPTGPRSDGAGDKDDTLITKIPVFDAKDLAEDLSSTGRRVRPSSIVQSDDAEEDEDITVQPARRLPETGKHALIGPLRTQRARQRPVLGFVAAAALVLTGGIGYYLYRQRAPDVLPAEPAKAPERSGPAEGEAELEFIEPTVPGAGYPEGGAATEGDVPGTTGLSMEGGDLPSGTLPGGLTSIPGEPREPLVEASPGRSVRPRSTAESQLDRAGRALSAGSIVDPPGGSAFDYLSEAKRMDPSNPEVESLVRVAAERLRQQVAQLKAQRRHREAIQDLDRALALFPRLQELRALQSSLRVEELLAGAQEAFERNRLVAPAQQSALYFLDQVSLLDPNNEAARAQEQRLKTRLRQEIQTLQEQRRQREAEVLLDSALQIRPNDAELVRLRASLREAPAGAAPPAVAKGPPAPSREPPPTTFELPAGSKTPPPAPPLHRPRLPTSVGRNCTAEIFTQAAPGGPLVGLWRDSPIAPGNNCIMIHDTELPLLKTYDFDNRPSAFCVAAGVVAELYPDSNYQGNCRLVVAGPFCVNDMKRVSKCDGGHWGDVLSSVRARQETVSSPGIREH